MNGRPNISYTKRQQRPELVRMRQPFWLPASNFYVLAAAVSIAFFFLVWGILHDGGEETPWITSGIGASILLGGAVILREVILRRARNRYLKFEKRLDKNLNEVYSQIGDNRNLNKLTIEKNAAILRELKQKSDAAKVLDRYAAGHREVFEVCGEYIIRNDQELRTIGAGSPRFGALLKGRAAAAEYHRFHVLRWAEIEARALTSDAKNRTRASDRVEAAQNALSVIESALEFYPEEESLLESRELLLELVASIKVSNWVEKAERAAFKGDYTQAKSLYRDALFYLGRDNVQSDSRERAAVRINAEIERIRLLENGE